MLDAPSVRASCKEQELEETIVQAIVAKCVTRKQTYYKV